MKKAVFFDRDGTLTHTVLRNERGKQFDNWPRDISELRIVDGAAEIVNYAKLN